MLLALIQKFPFIGMTKAVQGDHQSLLDIASLAAARLYRASDLRVQTVMRRANIFEHAVRPEGTQPDSLSGQHALSWL